MVSERVVLTPKTEESSDVYSRVCHPGLVPGSAYTVLLTYTELLAFLTPNQIFLQLTIVSFLFLDCFAIKMYLFRNV